MKFEDFKKSFFNSRNKKEPLTYIKTFFDDYNKLNKFIQRFEREFPGFNSLIKDVILGENSLPKQYSELNKSKQPLFSESLKKELNWVVLAVCKESSLIQSFIRHRANFENMLMKGAYESARRILDEIEKDICVSYWSIENRLILDELEFSSERNWETRNSIVDEKNHPFVRVLGHLFSYKVEKSVSFSKYNEFFVEFEDAENLTQEEQNYYQEYFRFKANYFFHPEFNLFDYILYFEGTASIIDRYISLISVLQNLAITKKISSTYIDEILVSLIGSIEDTSLTQISFYRKEFVGKKIGAHDSQIISIIDKYTMGDYQASSKASKKFLSDIDANCMELVEIYSKSLVELELQFRAITEQDSILNTIARYYYDILSKNESTERSLSELLKLSYVFNNSTLGLNIYSFIKQELDWTTAIDYTFISRLNSKFINPRLWDSLVSNKSSANLFIQNLEKAYSNSVTVEVFKSLENAYTTQTPLSTTERIPGIKYKLYDIRNMLLRGDFEAAIESYSSLLHTQKLSMVAGYEIVSNIFRCYLERNDLRNCLITYTNAFIKNPYLVMRCDGQKLAAAILKGKFKNVGLRSDLIDLPIFFKVNSSEKIQIKQAYEQFLTSNNWTKPSQLLSFYKGFDREKLIFFLKNVCTEEIMQLSKYIDSTQNVNEERITICQFLAGFDSANAEAYNNEISITTQKNVISKVIGRFDERKIYVNDERLKNLLLKTDQAVSMPKEHTISIGRDSFDRYVKLMDFVKQNEFKDVNGVLRFGEDGQAVYEVKSKEEILTNGKEEYDVILYMPVFRMFKDFFIYIRDLFVFNNEYGLDAYLSSKIRHGTLPNHLRSVFETYRLVTAQDNGVYTKNSYWIEKLTVSEDKQEVIQTLLAKFSRDIDEVSKNLKDELIQCKTEKRVSKKIAMFDHAYDQNELILLFLDSFSEVRNYEEFIEISFEELWNKTENCLHRIRSKIDTDLKLEFGSILFGLENSLLRLTEKNDIKELLHNINICRTEIQMKLSNISTWFRRSESSFEGNYDIETLMNTSIQIIKNINPNYNFEIKKNIQANSSIKAEYHQHFIEAINILLQNMIEHSKVPASDLSASIAMIESNDLMEARFNNRIAKILSEQELTEKLGSIKSNWNNSDNNVSVEKNSGYPKIKKILRSDLGVKNSLFDFKVQDSQLEILISFKTNDLKYENTTN